MIVSVLTSRKENSLSVYKNNMSSIKEILTGVPQGPVLSWLLFLIYINDLHKSIRFSKTYHFADDTIIIKSNPLLDRLSKQVNKNLSNLANWLRAHKLSFNVKKTEVVIFRPRKLKIDHRKLHMCTYLAGKTKINRKKNMRKVVNRVPTSM